jgi:hypothetical protein
MSLVWVNMDDGDNKDSDEYITTFVWIEIEKMYLFVIQNDVKSAVLKTKTKVAFIDRL